MRLILEHAQKAGAVLYLDGKRSSPEVIYHVYQVEEENVYMPDYIMDCNGRLAQLRYDKIIREMTPEYIYRQ